jgi:phospholipase C
MRRALAALALAALAAVPAGCGGAARSSLERASSAVQVCGTTKAPVEIRHVVWIWLENHSYAQLIGEPGTGPAEESPYLNGLAAGCGLATRYSGITHPSLPNYVAAVSGGTQGIRTDCAPDDCSTDAPSLFGQLQQAGKTWRVYEEDMPAPCAMGDTALYVAKHNPATYFDDAGRRCEAWDVPYGSPGSGGFADQLVSGALPAFTMLVPNMCNDDHDCPPSSGDRWLRGVVGSIAQSGLYRAGRLALFITWDEGDGDQKDIDCLARPHDEGCHVATVVVSAATPRGARSDTSYSHYSLLRTTEELLGLPLLGAARGAPSLAPAFGLR